MSDLLGTPAASQQPPEPGQGRWYPEMPPALPGETDEQYTDRLTGADGTNRRPYDHRRNRQCSIGYHDECSDRADRSRARTRADGGCECPCHYEPSQQPPEPAPQTEAGKRLVENIRTILERANDAELGSWLRFGAQGLDADVARIEAESRAAAEAEHRQQMLTHGQINVGTVYGYEAGLEEGRRAAAEATAAPAGLRERLFEAVRHVITDGIDSPGVYDELHMAFYAVRDAAAPLPAVGETEPELFNTANPPPNYVPATPTHVREPGDRIDAGPINIGKLSDVLYDFGYDVPYDRSLRIAQAYAARLPAVGAGIDPDLLAMALWHAAQSDDPYQYAHTVAAEYDALNRPEVAARLSGEPVEPKGATE